MTTYIETLYGGAKHQDRWASLSNGGEYRYTLGRVWDPKKKRVLFVMLNPSTADAEKDDATVRRCMAFAKFWGYGSLEVGNLFAFRARFPKALRAAQRPIGIDNASALRVMQGRATLTILAWGNHGDFMDQGRNVALELADRGPVAILGITNRGQPRHPLYAPATLTPDVVSRDLCEWIGVYGDIAPGRCFICGKFKGYVKDAGCCTDCCDLEPGHGHPERDPAHVVRPHERRRQTKLGVA